MKKLFTGLLCASALMFSLSCLSCNSKANNDNKDNNGGNVDMEEYKDTLINDFDALNEEHVRYLGRHVKSKINEKDVMLFSFSATGFDLFVDIKEESNEIVGKFYSYRDGYQNGSYIKTIVDGEEKETIKLDKIDEVEVTLFKDLPVGKHTLRVLKLNEASTTKMGLCSITSTNVDFYSRRYNSARKYIEFYGDSITAGYGNLGDSSSKTYYTNEQDASKSYAYLASEELGVDSSLICWSGTALSAKLAPYGACIMDVYDTVEGSIKYDMKEDNPSIIVINLGSNDHGKYVDLTTQEEQKEGIEEFIKNYSIIVDSIMEHNKTAKVISLYNCCYSIASGLVKAIKTATQNINDKYGENTAFIIKGMTNQNGANGHPNVKGHEYTANQLVKFIKENNLL